MISLKYVNECVVSNKQIEATLAIRDLIFKTPSFKQYYINYLMSFKGMPKDIRELMHLGLQDDEVSELLDIEKKIESILMEKWSGKKISFCIPLKNRSCVQVQWNGVTRKKTFLSSYKDKPRTFRLELLKNFIWSIVNSHIRGVLIEVIIVDFGSTDDHPKKWIDKIIGENPDITSKIIELDESFGRGRGLNIASQHATGDIVFFTDADMLISREFLVQCFEIAYDQQKAFFPVCYSYYTPFHKEGWIRNEGWGNLIIPNSYKQKISWWEKNSWGSEDNHMKDQLKNNFVRVQGVGFYHQWHPEDDFKTKYYISEKNKFDVVMAVTTYNRLEYLKEFLDTWYRTKNSYYNWHLIINDDGSTDGTIQYLKSLKLTDINIHVIYNKRKGVHEGTNAIFDRVYNIKPDYIFKCDDDVVFNKEGWDNAYIQGLQTYPFICNYQTSWRNSKILSQSELFVSYSNAYYSQGAFIAMTYQALAKIGWMDTKAFGFKGYGHIDYAVRACRAGFNRFETFYDIKDSIDYIKYQTGNYKPALSTEEMKNEFGLTVDEKKKEKMKKFILQDREHLIYVNRSSIFEFADCNLKPSVHIIIHNNHVGGAEYVHLNHIQALNEWGVKVKVWSVGKGYTFDKILRLGVDIVYVPELFNNSGQDWLKFVSTINDGDYIYNCNAYNDEMFKSLAFYRYFYYITILHSNVDWIIKHQQQYKYFTYKYIAINQYIATSLVNMGVNKNKIAVLPNSLDGNFEFDWKIYNSNKIRESLGIPKQSLVVGFVGRIAKDKNAVQLVNLANKLNQRRDDIYFLVIGGVSERQVDKDYYNLFLKAIGDINSKSKFFYVGEKLGNELIEYYDAIDVAINISPSEGLPITLLEELGRGAYCVYPSFPAIKDLLKNFKSKVIDIKQRKTSNGLEYNDEELDMYVEYLSSLNREQLNDYRAINIDVAKNLFCYEITKDGVAQIFFARSVKSIQ